MVFSPNEGIFIRRCIASDDSITPIGRQWKLYGTVLGVSLTLKSHRHLACKSPQVAVPIGTMFLFFYVKPPITDTHNIQRMFLQYRASFFKRLCNIRKELDLGDNA